MSAPPTGILAHLLATHEALESAGIPHGLIGGWAAIAWGRVRATRDVDWIADIPSSQKKEVLAILGAFGKPEWREAGEDDPVAGVIRVVPSTQDKKIDEGLLSAACRRRGVLDRLSLIRKK